MSTSITINKTVSVGGTCPMDGQTAKIDVTYQKYQPVGSECAYAIVTKNYCDKVNNGCPVEQCPIAYSRIYW